MKHYNIIIRTLFETKTILKKAMERKWSSLDLKKANFISVKFLPSSWFMMYTHSWFCRDSISVELTTSLGKRGILQDESSTLIGSAVISVAVVVQSVSWTTWIEKPCASLSTESEWKTIETWELKNGIFPVRDKLEIFNH